VTGVNAAAKAAVSTSARSTVVRIIAVPPTWNPSYLNACSRWL
jgi:7,8-dihydro-6-hydroxymethylpterin-pyrophosphokinase